MADLQFEVPEGAVEGLFSQPGGEGFRALVESVVQALINRQADEHFGAPWNARGVERPNGYRNGYKSRGFQTVAGEMDLSVPQARNGSFRLRRSPESGHFCSPEVGHHRPGRIQGPNRLSC